MVQLVLLLIGALVVGAIVFGVAVLLGGDGLDEIEPDGRSQPLPVVRPLVEDDVAAVRFDTVLRGYRMAQVDEALRRAAYDIGFKTELIEVLEAEVRALRSGDVAEADSLRAAREGAMGTGAGEIDPEIDPDAQPGEMVVVPSAAAPSSDPSVSDAPEAVAEPASGAEEQLTGAAANGAEPSGN